MKTHSTQITRVLVVLAVFSLTTLISYGAIISSGGLLKSTPYMTRNTTADATLNRLTNGAGAAILNNVIASVRAKAIEKGGSPVNATLYNNYINSRLLVLDQLDDQVRREYGPDYAFLFQYIYPRILELKQGDGAIGNIIDRINTDVGREGTGSTNDDSIDTNVLDDLLGTGTGASNDSIDSNMLDDLLDTSTGTTQTSDTTNTNTTNTGTSDSVDSNFLDDLLK